jgi:hypothetical protein
VDKPAIAKVEADMRYARTALSEGQDITRQQGACVSPDLDPDFTLLTAGPWQVDAMPAKGVLDQP